MIIRLYTSLEGKLHNLFDYFHIAFPLLLPELIILPLNTPLDGPIFLVYPVLIRPTEVLVTAEVLPLLVELVDRVRVRSRVPETRVVCVIFSRISYGFNYFGF